jgi:hypothetical protein
VQPALRTGPRCIYSTNSENNLVIRVEWIGSIMLNKELNIALDSVLLPGVNTETDKSKEFTVSIEFNLLTQKSLTVGTEFRRKQRKIEHAFVIDKLVAQAAVTPASPTATNISLKASTYTLLASPVSYEMNIDFPTATLNTIGTNANLGTLKSMRGSKFVLDLKSDYGIMAVGGNFINSITFKDL